MNLVDSQMRQAMLAGAAALPAVAAGMGRELFEPQWSIRKRPNGYWAIYRNDEYVVSTRTRDEAKAKKVLEVHILQVEARQRGIVDPRGVPAPEVTKFFLDQLAGDAGVRRGDLTVRLKRLEPFLARRTLADLDGVWMAQAEKAMRKAGYAPMTVENSFQTLQQAIRKWSMNHSVPPLLLFQAPRYGVVRDRILSPEEQKLVLRWCDGDEDYDIATGTWKPAKLCPRSRHTRRMTGRVIRIGLATASRPGRYGAIAWAPNPHMGHIDVAQSVFHRCPLGTAGPSNKNAPPVVLSPLLAALVAKWREEDGPNARYVIRNYHGEPYVCGAYRLIAPAMRAVGIRGVGAHTLRHTRISAMVAAGKAASVICAVAGITPQVLHRRYNHSDVRVIQPLAHDAMDALLLHGIATFRTH